MGFYGPLFLGCRGLARLFLPRCRMQGFPPEDAYPVVFVSRHQNYDGMVSVMAHIQKPVHVWSLDLLTQVKSCQNHYYTYTFTQRYHMPRLLARVCSWVGGWAMAHMASSMQAIPVHRGKRTILETFRQSAQCLHRGESILIFPDVEYTDEGPQAGAMYPGFLHLERMCRKEYGEAVRFVPLYTSRRTHTISAGEAITFDSERPFAQEKERVIAALQDAMNAMAVRCGDLQAEPAQEVLDE